MKNQIEIEELNSGVYLLNLIIDNEPGVHLIEVKK